MPAQKDFKRLVRDRMRKTGESYTAARARLLQKKTRIPQTEPVPVAPAPAPPAAPDYARLAGMSDAAVKAKTGCDWSRWVWALDRVGAHEWSHRDIARHVGEKYRVPGWWAQTVTVGYERIKGLRARGQRRDGGFEANKSRTFPVPVARLYRACRDPRTRSRWLPGEALQVRTASPSRSMRVSWGDGTAVDFWFTGKGRGKSQVQISHRKLADQASAGRARSYWAGRLEALGEVLSGG